MSADPISILGGESVYCINEGQVKDAKKLAYEDEESSPKIQSLLKSGQPLCSHIYSVMMVT